MQALSLLHLQLELLYHSACSSETNACAFMLFDNMQQGPLNGARLRICNYV